MTSQNQKIVAVVSTSAVAVIGIIATVVMVVVALNNGKNGAILMSGFALIGTLVGIAAGYNAKKLKEIKNQFAQAAGVLKEPDHEPGTRNDK